MSRLITLLMLALTLAASAHADPIPAMRPYYFNPGGGTTLTNPVTGTCGTTNAVAYFTGTSTIACSAVFTEVAASGALTLSLNQNATTSLLISNTTNAANAYAMVQVTSNSGSGYLYAASSSAAAPLTSATVLQSDGMPLRALVTSGADPSFYITHVRGTPSNDFRDDPNGHINHNATASSDHAASTTCTAVTVSGDDVSGTILATCGAGTIVKVDFGATWTSTIVDCLCSQSSGAAAYAVSCSATTTQLTMTSIAGTAGAGGGWKYMCIGRQ